MTKRILNLKWSLSLCAGLISLLGLNALAKMDRKRVQFVDDITREAMQNPKTGKQLKTYMRDNSLSAETIVTLKMPTPANVQQYGKSNTKGGSESKTFYSSDAEARAALKKVAKTVLEVKEEAKDAPQKYVAETSGKVVNILGEAYNELAVEVHQKINSIRAKLQEMVAIALIVNGGTAGGAGNLSQGGQLTGQALEARKANKAFNAADAQLGQTVIALVGPEVPLARYAVGLYEQAKEETKDISKLTSALAKKLNMAESKTGDVVNKQKEYEGAMKGKENASNTAKVLRGATNSLGNHLMMVTNAAERLLGFQNGPGQTIKDVLACSIATYEAGVALTQDTPDDIKTALGQKALDSNIKAARGVGPMADEWYNLLAWLDQEASSERISLPGFQDLSAPTAHPSKSGDRRQAEKEIKKQLPKVME